MNNSTFDNVGLFFALLFLFVVLPVSLWVVSYLG